MAPAVVIEPERRRKRRPRSARDEAVAVKIARWSEQKSELPEDTGKCRGRMQAKGSKKGCMKGKGGPENENCTSRGVRQRKWGKWVAEIRLPNGRGRMWLGTFATEAEAATAYDNAAAAMYGRCARLNAPQTEASGSDPAPSPTLPGERGGDPTPCDLTLLPEEQSDSTSCLTQPEGHGDPAYLSSGYEVYDDPTTYLTLPELHGGLTYYPTGDPAQMITLPEFYGDPAYLNGYPTCLSGRPGVRNDHHLNLSEFCEDPTCFGMDEICGSPPAHVNLPEDHGRSVSSAASQVGPVDHAHIASATGPSSFIASPHQDVGGRSTGDGMEHPQVDQINKTTNIEELEDFRCEEYWLEDFSCDFSLEDFLSEIDDGVDSFDRMKP